ncbi:MAG: MBL fold metallo-hydrolase [Clostridia bacterium]|nr:MBL fold metallo-hydrolase [Clostridia bacterium]
MKLQFTGIGAAYYPVLGSNCAFFEHGDQLFLIDCGESTFKAMFARSEIFRYRRITVLITHLHADHIGSLGSFLSFCKNVLNKKATLIAEEETVVHVLSECGVQPDLYHFTTDFSQCNAEGFSIQPVRVKHADDMLCCGFLIECNGEKTYFSGDTCLIPEDILHSFLSGEIQTMYQECTYLNTDSPSHCSLQKLCTWIPEKDRDRVYCMHLGGDFRGDIYATGFRIPEIVS